ncbi:MAG: DMT family transporter, partial [Alphaproteobacteria bacterium]|nr:DMT family transporter [Alphaproteobacteria bacterium]
MTPPNQPPSGESASRAPLASRVFREPRAMLGIALKIISVFMFTAMLSISKAYQDYPLTVIIFYRSFFALLVLFAWLAWRGAFPRALYTRRIGGHMLRSIAGIGSMYFMFAAYQALPLADATAFSYLQPLLVALLAVIILRERVTALRLGAIAAGFAGVLVMLWQHLGGASASPDYLQGAALALIAALLVAVVFIQIRRLTESEDSGAIVFYFQFTTTCAALLVLFLSPYWPQGAPGAGWMQAQAWVWPKGLDVFPLMAIGVMRG